MSTVLAEDIDEVAFAQSVADATKLLLDDPLSDSTKRGKIDATIFRPNYLAFLWDRDTQRIQRGWTIVNLRKKWKWADSKVKCNTCKPVRSADAKHVQTVSATSA